MELELTREHRDFQLRPCSLVVIRHVLPDGRVIVDARARPPEGIHPDAGKDTVALPVPNGFTKEQVALGNRVFHGEVADGTCGGCHGSDGKGSPFAPDLTRGQWLWSDGSLQGLETTIKNGVPEPKAHPGAMPPMGGVVLSQADLDAVSAYVWALGHQKPWIPPGSHRFTRNPHANRDHLNLRYQHSNGSDHSNLGWSRLAREMRVRTAFARGSSVVTFAYSSRLTTTCMRGRKFCG